MSVVAVIFMSTAAMVFMSTSRTVVLGATMAGVVYMAGRYPHTATAWRHSLAWRFGVVLYPYIVLRMAGVDEIPLVAGISNERLAMASPVGGVFMYVPVVVHPWARLVDHYLISII